MKIASTPIGRGAPLVLIAGPCVLEGPDFVLAEAEKLARTAARFGFPLVYKASFDKANRTRGGAPRGPGLQGGLEILRRVRDRLGLPILTDVHEAGQCGAASEVADVLQIPAFLCRQTDLIAAAAKTGRVVNIKKGPFLAASEMVHVAQKAQGAAGVLLTERGTFFGYGDLVVDMRGLSVMREIAPVVFDGTHSVQRPGAAAGQSGGDRRFVRPLVRAAIAAGVDALFLEVHPRPDEAPSDGATSLDDRSLELVLEDARRVESITDRRAEHE